MASRSPSEPLVLTAEADPVTGQAVYTLPGPALAVRAWLATRDLLLAEGGKVMSLPRSGTSVIPVSRLPEERMAATWEDIVRTLRTAEDGRSGAVDVELRPGGELVLTDREQSAQPLSQLPKGRMAWQPPN